MAERIIPGAKDLLQAAHLADQVLPLLLGSAMSLWGLTQWEVYVSLLRIVECRGISLVQG